MIKRNSILWGLLLLSIPATAQVTFPVNGARTEAQTAHVFENATIVVDSGTTIQSGTMVVRAGKIEAIGSKIAIPEDAEVHNMEGLYIYPSFVDPHTDYGMPEVKRAQWTGRPQYESKKKGNYHWNEAIHPETRSIEHFQHDPKKRSHWTHNGYGTVVSHHQDGIMRGNAMVTTLAPLRENATVLMHDAAGELAFNKGSSAQDYPSSLMGMIALLRQTYYDAFWNHEVQEESSLALNAVYHWKDLPQVFSVYNKHDILRADKIGDEFDIQYIFAGGTDHYKRIKEMKATGASFIISLDFPEAYDVSDAYDAMNVTLAEMKHWEMAPRNPAELAQAGIRFAFTLDGLESGKAFFPNLRKAIQHGLSEAQALQALTVTPAEMFGFEDKVGTLEAGKLANFIICSGNIFHDGRIREHWIQGVQAEVLERDAVVDVRGTYNLRFADARYELKVTGTEHNPEGSVKVIRDVPADTVINLNDGLADTTIAAATTDTVNVKVKINTTGNVINLSFAPYDQQIDGVIRANGTVNFDSAIWDGMAELPGGHWINWTAIRKDKHVEEEASAQPMVMADSVGTLLYPNMAYGYPELPQQQNMVIRNATVWTSDIQGVLEETDVLVIDGKIQAIGKNLDVTTYTDVQEVDGRGKHLTAGLIDEHSHIAISRGVNEGTQAVTAEVSIADVIESEDIDIYRQLAGGTTTSQLLHGSANPIGGQSALIKLRWGVTPEEMKFGSKYGYIKFALGENVKQSNWGDYQTVRFPQTRMGVEQVFYDAFLRAREYAMEWDMYNNLTPKEKLKATRPRRDLELDALVEILEETRFITCHSYVQSEINMLMHVADSMGFTLNTFTHILEGYKVADKMVEHGAGGSTFSDWWAYKFEVNDAIPYNAAIMDEMGIVVAINSDDAEMGRRLNQEAAKGVKYGGMSEEDALNMVTINPAKLLHIEDRVGSITVGKDADLVLWTDHPLSIYAIVDKTIIDGTVYFDLATQDEVRAAMAAERNRLIEKMMAAKAGGAPTQKPKYKKKMHYHCNTLGEEATESHDHH